MSHSPYRKTEVDKQRCKGCGARLAASVNLDSQGPAFCEVCFAERYDLPVVLAVICLAAGASTGSIVFVAGALAISCLAAYVIRRLV